MSAPATGKARPDGAGTDSRPIREISLGNLLSFGPETTPLPLRSLNVVIGPNGSGKSNLIEAIGLLKSLPRDLSRAIREGGGIQEWVWKGSDARDFASLDAVVAARAGGDAELAYSVMVSGVSGRTYV